MRSQRRVGLERLGRVYFLERDPRRRASGAALVPHRAGELQELAAVLLRGNRPIGQRLLNELCSEARSPNPDSLAQAFLNLLLVALARYVALGIMMVREAIPGRR